MPTGTSTTVVLQGRSGAKYQFWVYPWGQEFKAQGGVYAVLREEAGTYVVVYVGQTGDLSERFDNHHKSACFAGHLRTHIAAQVQESERQRLGIERDLIDFYDPPCNEA